MESDAHDYASGLPGNDSLVSVVLDSAQEEGAAGLTYIGKIYIVVGVLAFVCLLLGECALSQDSSLSYSVQHWICRALSQQALRRVCGTAPGALFWDVRVQCEEKVVVAAAANLFVWYKERKGGSVGLCCSTNDASDGDAAESGEASNSPPPLFSHVGVDVCPSLFSSTSSALCTVC